jgi:hypothetical protein
LDVAAPPCAPRTARSNNGPLHATAAHPLSSPQ